MTRVAVAAHRGRIGFEGNFSVRRADFGITKMKGAVGETLHIIVAVEGIKK